MNSAFRFNAKPSSSFDADKNKLFLHRFDRSIVATGWPDIRAWWITRKVPKWRGTILWDKDFKVLPHKELIDAETSPHKHHLNALQSFSNTIPDKIRELVGQFSWHHWSLLSMLARCPESEDLMRTAPILAFCNANVRCFRKLSGNHMRATKRQIYRKRLEQARYLGFKAENKLLTSALNNISPAAIEISLAIELKEKLNANSAITKTIAHFPTPLNREQIKLLLNAYDSVMQLQKPMDFLLSIDGKSIHQRLHTAHYYFQATKNLAEIQNQGFYHVKSITELRDLHNELVDNLGNQAYLPQASRSIPEETVFNSPPFAGNHFISPITTYKDLVTWGNLQKNCVAGYANHILDGQYYVYRWEEIVNGNVEQATIGLEKTMGRWHINEIAGYRNEEVSLETTNAVESWLFQERLNSPLTLQSDDFDDDIPF